MIPPIGIDDSIITSSATKTSVVQCYSVRLVIQINRKQHSFTISFLTHLQFSENSFGLILF